MAQNKLDKRGLVSMIGSRACVQNSAVEAVLKALPEVLYDECSTTGSATIPGIGKLVIVHRKERWCRNPSTGQNILVPERKAVKFRLSVNAKRGILD